jgi:HEAT repeat protein
MPSDKIINYRALIEKSTRDFTGRQWVRDSLDAFLQMSERRYFLLLGEPGCGKTAFMADLVWRRGYPHHFFGRGSQIDLVESAEWRSLLRMAESIGYQLIRDYGGWVMDWDGWGIHVDQQVQDLQGLLIGARVAGYQATPLTAGQAHLSVKQELLQFGPAARAIGVYIEKFETDVKLIVHQLLTTPLRRVARRYPHEPLVIALDGLDEGEAAASPGYGILANLPDGDLPDNVRFILSTRPDLPKLEALKRQAEIVWLSQDEQGRCEPGIDLDGRAFLETKFEAGGLANLLARRHKDPNEFIDQVVQASQGNFLYLRYLIQELLAQAQHEQKNLRGNDRLLDLETLPQGLNAIYAEFLENMRARQEISFWIQTVKPLLSVLAVAQAPLTQLQIAGLAGINPDTAGALLVHLKQFLEHSAEGRGRCYAIYHASFGEYLLSDENEDSIDPQAAHQRITDFYLQNYRRAWQTCDDYGLDFTVTHVLKAYQDPAELALVLKRLFTTSFMEARSDRAGWHMPFVRDLQKVAAATPDQAVVPSLQILEGSHRNSLVNQSVLRLLRDLRPKLNSAGLRIARDGRNSDMVLEQALDALNCVPDQAVPELGKLIRATARPRLKAVLVLALGETACPLAISTLVENLVNVKKRSDDHVSWCAAEALIALNSPASVEPLLLNFHDSQVKPGVKQRIIYALGRMGAQLELEEARNLVEKGLALRGNLKARAIDFMYLYKPEDPADLLRWCSQQEPVLWEILGFDSQDVDQDHRPGWSDEWLQKRAVTALGRIGSPDAIPHLERLARELQTRPLRPTRMLKQKRESLIASIPRAIFELKQRHLYNKEIEDKE